MTVLRNPPAVLLCCGVFICASCGSKALNPTNDDYSATLTSNDTLIVAIPGRESLLKEIDVRSGNLMKTRSIEGTIVGLHSVDNKVVAVMRSRTPLNRSTLQVYDLGLSEFRSLFPEDESMRFAVGRLGGELAYLKRSVYGGASAGSPWIGPTSLCVERHGKEAIVMSNIGVADRYGSSQGEGFPFFRYAATKRYDLVLVLKSGEVINVDQTTSPGTAVTSRSGNVLAVSWMDNAMIHLRVYDVYERKWSSTLTTSKRVTQLLFGADDALYALVQDSHSVEFAAVRGGTLVHLFDIR